MNDEEVSALRDEIASLRNRLAAAQEFHAETLAGIGMQLDALEAKLPATVAQTPAARLDPPVPVAEPPVPTPPPFPAGEESIRQWQAVASSEPIAAPLPLPARPLPLPPKPEGSFELRFGRVWLVRFGIALLLTGLVLLGNFAYKNWIYDLPAGVRLAALYLGSFLLAGEGARLARRENLARFGEVLLAGGLAFFYWCTFAAYHVPRLRVIDSPVLAGGLLLLAAGGIVAISLRRDSRVTAVMGLLLASYATVLQPLGWLSAASNVVLAAAGTALMLRPRWTMPGIAAMAGTYVSFLWWQVAGAAGGASDGLSALWFLPPVWAVFALPGVIGISHRFEGFSDRARAWFASANNGAFFLLFSLTWLRHKGSEDF